jgi:hypothetical protein
MSYVAIAAALALDDVSAGERLAAFSLASYANREHRAWPGTGVAAARAGLSRSQYLAARDSLRKRSLIVVEDAGGGRGNSSTVRVLFAELGPWLEGQINAALFEAVLGRSRSKGAARLLLAALAALADDELAVADRTTDEIRSAAGMADRTYRRARAALLASGELVLEAAGGGRARTNHWLLRDPRAANPCPTPAPRTRIAPSRTARPLVAAVKQPLTLDAAGSSLSETSRVKGPGLTGVSVTNPGQDRTVYAGKGPGLTGVSGTNPGQDQTVSAETPAQTPAETPAPHVRAWKEPQNHRTNDPPTPPEGGSPLESIVIEQAYRTGAGRRRSRTVRVDLAEVRRGLGLPAAEDRAGWERIRSTLLEALGESTFALWIEPLELIAVDRSGALVIAAPPDTVSWVQARFGRIIAAFAQRVGHQLRLADEPERRALGPNDGRAGAVFAAAPEINQTEVS